MIFRKLRMPFLAVFCFTVLILIIMFPTQSANGAKYGLLICANVLIPSLFPFCAFALFTFKCGVSEAIASKINKVTSFLFHINGLQFCVYFTSLNAGYPVGIKLINQLANDNLIDNKEAQKMSLYCVNAGPAFVLLAVGKAILGNIMLGVILLISTMLSSFLIMIITEINSRPVYKGKVQLNNASDSFVKSVADASASMIGISSFVVLFSSFSEIIKSINLELFNKFFCVFGEVASACIYNKGNIPLLAFILGFGGFCVHLQIYSQNSERLPNYGVFFVFRILHGELSFLICKLLLKIYPIGIETFSNNQDFSFMFFSSNSFASLFLIALSIMLIFSINQSEKKLL